MAVTRHAALAASTAVGLAVASMLLAGPAAAKSTTPISGWCTTGPITYSVDTTGLSKSKAASAVRTINKVMRSYSRDTGLTFTYAGKLRTINRLFSQPRTIKPLERNIAFAFLPRLSMPSAGAAGVSTDSGPESQRVFEFGYVTLAANLPGTSAITDVTIHEVGHVMGFEHTADRSSVMHPTVYPGSRLSPREVKAMKAALSVCPSGTATNSPVAEDFTVSNGTVDSL